jgi:hypothetical protein
MERFEMTVIAQGPHSVWIALLVIALICVTAIAMVFAFFARKVLFHSAVLKPTRLPSSARYSSISTLPKQAGRQRATTPKK